jgi:hypothetical protein
MHATYTLPAILPIFPRCLNLFNEVMVHSFKFSGINSQKVYCSYVEHGSTTIQNVNYTSTTIFLEVSNEHEIRVE